MSLIVHPLVLAHTCLAYARPELRTLDSLLASPHSLPTELLLTIRTHLHRSIAAHSFAAAETALAAYEHALVAGLCDDCVRYNSDVFSPHNVWAWVAAGCTSPCQCRSLGHARTPLVLRSPPFTHGGVSAVPSPAAWLDAHLSLVCAGRSVWAELVPDVLATLGCEIIPQSDEIHSRTRIYTGVPPLDDACFSHTPLGRDAHSPFGAPITIRPSPTIAGQPAAVVLQRLSRELGLHDFDINITNVEERTRPHLTRLRAARIGHTKHRTSANGVTSLLQRCLSLARGQAPLKRSHATREHPTPPMFTNSEFAVSFIAFFFALRIALL